MSPAHFKPKKPPVCISAPLELALSPRTCSKIIAEVIKYILYQKEQIPCSFDSLQDVARKSSVHNSSIVMSPTYAKQKELLKEGRRNKQVVLAVGSLESIFQNLASELEVHSNGVKEIVVLMGSTPMTPQDVYTIIVPPLALEQCEPSAAYRKSLLSIIRCLAMSDDLNDVLGHPMSTTNSYVYLKKNRSSDRSDWFLPKDRYKLPTRGQHVTISLLPSEPCPSIRTSFEMSHSTDVASECGFVICPDDEVGISSASRVVPSARNTRALQDSSPSGAVTSGTLKHLDSGLSDDLQWYQAPLVLKGFKYC